MIYDNIKVDLYEYDLLRGWKVLAGKTELDNDILSLKIARPNDLWFHVRGFSGSHVVLQGPLHEPEKEIIKQAAAIAAYHSKARAGGVVPVSYTRAHCVTKPRGAKPGTVQIKREKMIKVRPGLPKSIEE
jgi:predicted ribosome quality control (RQC) complex YloA/Tae2 family protein